MSYDAIAELYDAAFAWESDPGAIVPLYRQLGSPRRILEVACGPARLLASLVEEGAYGVGIDVSSPMLDLARRRLAAIRPDGFDLRQADMRDFTLDAPVQGAFCAVGSFGHLATTEDAARHLASMRSALAPGAVYAIQLNLQPVRDTAAREPSEHSVWEFEHRGERLRYAWFGRGIDSRTAREIQVSRVEWLSGPNAGQLIETDHEMHIWDRPSWRELLASAGFVQIAALDPMCNFEEIALDEALYERPVAWHLIRC